MAKTISTTLNDDPEKLIEQARELALKTGITFEGDHTGGNYSGFGLEGEYAIQDRQLTLTIHKKPSFIPWNVIESKIKSFFA